MGDGTVDDTDRGLGRRRGGRDCVSPREQTSCRRWSVAQSTADTGPLGVASVLPGDSDELFAVVAEGSAATEIGVFGIDAADCLFSYTYSGSSDDFTMLIRPLSPVRSGALCFAGGIDLFSAEQRPDGTWDASSAVVRGRWTVDDGVPGAVPTTSPKDSRSRSSARSSSTASGCRCSELDDADDGVCQQRASRVAST